MLFDVRGRHRRRAVRVIYIGLALLFLVGFVGFGVGVGGGGGGLISSLTNNEGSNTASFAGTIKKYQKLTQQQPSNVYAWEQLTLAQLHEAGGEAYVSNNALTSKGKELFSRVAQSWNGYLALNPPKPSPELAQEMVRVFGEEGLNQPAEAVKVLQIVVASRPQSAALYGALAEYAYKAHNVRQGDLASAKAVSLAPAAERTRLKTELAALKKNPTGSEALTATEGGKTYKVKPGGNGTFTGTASTPTPTPAPAAPSKKK